MKNILRKTRNGLAVLVLTLAGCGNPDIQRAVEYGRQVVEQKVVGIASSEKPNKEQHFTRKLYVGESEYAVFDSCDYGEIKLKFHGIVADSFGLSSSNDRTPDFYSVDETSITFHGHRFEVLELTKAYVVFDHSVCPLTK